MGGLKVDVDFKIWGVRSIDRSIGLGGVRKNRGKDGCVDGKGWVVLDRSKKCAWDAHKREILV